MLPISNINYDYVQRLFVNISMITIEADESDTEEECIDIDNVIKQTKIDQEK